jgi:hypothetical protein
MKEYNCDYCKCKITTEKCIRIKVIVPFCETKYYIDGIARITLCQKCYSDGNVLKELNDIFMGNYGCIFEYDINEERVNIYDNFKHYGVLRFNQDEADALMYQKNIDVWMFLFNLMTKEIYSGNSIRIIQLMDAGMLSIHD